MKRTFVLLLVFGAAIIAVLTKLAVVRESRREISLQPNFEKGIVVPTQDKPTGSEDRKTTNAKTQRISTSNFNPSSKPKPQSESDSVFDRMDALRKGVEDQEKVRAMIEESGGLYSFLSSASKRSDAESSHLLTVALGMVSAGDLNIPEAEQRQFHNLLFETLRSGLQGGEAGIACFELLVALSTQPADIGSLREILQLAETANNLQPFLERISRGVSKWDHGTKLQVGDGLGSELYRLLLMKPRGSDIEYAVLDAISSSMADTTLASAYVWERITRAPDAATRKDLLWLTHFTQEKPDSDIQHLLELARSPDKTIAHASLARLVFFASREDAAERLREALAGSDKSQKESVLLGMGSCVSLGASTELREKFKMLLGEIVLSEGDPEVKKLAQDILKRCE